MRNTDNKQLDELLGEAFREQYEKEIKNGPADKDLEAMYPFTEENMKKAKELDFKNKKPFPWTKWLGKVAAVILCVSTATGVIVLSDPHIRGNVGSTVAGLIDEFISIDFTEAETNVEIEISKTRITYIPKGYTLSEDKSDEDSVSRTYENEAGEIIIIDVEISSDIKLMTEKNAHELEIEYINGYEGYISYSEELKQGSVYFGSSYFTVAISGMTEREELIKIAENIKFKD